MTDRKSQKNSTNTQLPWERVFLLFAIGVALLLSFGSSWPIASLLPTVSILMLAMVVAWLVRTINTHQRKWDAIANALPIPFSIASVPRFFDSYAKIAKSLSGIAAHHDLLFRELASARLESMADEAASLARGQIIFHATETWRTAYQGVLETLRVKTYYSVAWVRTNDYWADTPGRQSIQVNYDLIARGFRIERIHILSDAVWSFEAKMPIAGMLDWLVEQQARGIHVSLVREADLANEPGLLRDFAVYGDRATGVQELDEQARTQRFVLSFDPQSIRQALEGWERLKLFSISFADLMDRLGQS